MHAFLNRKKFLKPVLCGLLCALGGATLPAQSPNILWQQQQNSDRINAVVFTSDGSTLITGSSDRLINFWRASDGALLRVLNSNAPLETVSVRPLAPRSTLIAPAPLKVRELIAVLALKAVGVAEKLTLLPAVKVLTNSPATVPSGRRFLVAAS